jgi:CRP/FNR family transcriptional regulator, cyclic AMP receptor protein
LRSFADSIDYSCRRGYATLADDSDREPFTAMEIFMPCKPELLKSVPLFALLDEEETAVLASQVELKDFSARERIYKRGAPGGQAYVMISGMVRVSTVDEDGQEVIVHEPAPGEFFGFASMLEQTPHQTNAIALEATTCLEVGREDITVLLERKPHAGMDLLTVLGRQFHAAQELARIRASRDPNVIIEKEATLGERVADAVAGFGGSWTFISLFGIVLVIYTVANVVLDKKAWDPYPFILLNLFLSMLAAIQAPVIMMSQNRQNTRDRLRGDLDFDVNRRAETEIQGLARKLNQIDDKMHDFENLLRRAANTGPNSQAPS